MANRSALGRFPIILLNAVKNDDFKIYKHKWVEGGVDGTQVRLVLANIWTPEELVEQVV